MRKISFTEESRTLCQNEESKRQKASVNSAHLFFGHGKNSFMSTFTTGGTAPKLGLVHYQLEWPG